MCARLLTFIFEGADIEGVDGAGAAREGEACAGEDDEGIVRGCAKLEEVPRGVGACECPLNRGLGGSRSTGFGASSPLIGAFVCDCEGVCEVDAGCVGLASAASVMGISIGADGVLFELTASVCIGPNGADL
jgi:hypothetical protein